MKSFIQGLFALVIAATVGISLAPAGTIPQPFSTLPYVYDGVFPAGMLNNDFQYTLNYTDAITPQAWQVVTASGAAAAGNNLAVNTASAAITITLPAPSADAPSPVDNISLLDATNSFNTHNLTVNASGIAPINSLTGASAVVMNSTAGSVVECVYLNSTIGYNCNIR